MRSCPMNKTQSSRQLPKMPRGPPDPFKKLDELQLHANHDPPPAGRGRRGGLGATQLWIGLRVRRPEDGRQRSSYRVLPARGQPGSSRCYSPRPSRRRRLGYGQTQPRRTVTWWLTGTGGGQVRDREVRGLQAEIVEGSHRAEPPPRASRTFSRKCTFLAAPRRPSCGGAHAHPPGGGGG